MCVCRRPGLGLGRVFLASACAAASSPARVVARPCRNQSHHPARRLRGRPWVPAEPGTRPFVWECPWANDRPCVLAWAALSGHSSLRGFQIHVKTTDGRMFKDVAVTRISKSFVIQGLGPGTFLFQF